MPPEDREHGHRARGRRGDRSDSGVAAVARNRLGRPGHLPARPDGRGPDLRRPVARRGQGLPGRGRDPLPDARRRDRRVGRCRARPGRVPERESRRPRNRARGRPPDLQLRLARRGHARWDHARDPRPGSRLEHPDADQHPQLARRRPAALRALSGRARRRRQEALEASRSRLDRRVPRRRLPPRGPDELPRVARLELRRQDHRDEPGASSSSGSRWSASARARRPSTTRSSTG